MRVEVHLAWDRATHLVGRMHAAERSPTVSFEYSSEWLSRSGAFAIDPTGLPLRAGAHHRSGFSGPCRTLARIAGAGS